MLKIRLTKVGRKRINDFRIIVSDVKKPRDSGKFIEDLGYYKPQSKKNKLSINIDRCEYWKKYGAITTIRVYKLIKIAASNIIYVRK